MNRRTTSRRSRVLVAVGLVAAAVLLPACASDDAGVADTPDTTSAEATTTTPLEGEITVSAAASLTDVFGEIGKEFQSEHPGTTVTFNFDSSGTLATQIESGAPADVFASADTANMEKLSTAGLLAGEAVPFARNFLTIVVKPGNPTGLTGLSGLPTSGIVALCAETAPCGKYADQVLAAAGVTIPADRVTRGQNVKATLSAVAEGDADAGIVYVTDAAGSDAVDVVEIPEADNAVATYPIAVVGGSANVELAEAFVDYVTGDEGRAALADAGFLAP